MSMPLSPQEQLVRSLRECYECFGYQRFPMKRFEEYSLYATHQRFLMSESVLTFANADGKLMALKPDVTLSIAKQTKADVQGAERLYYAESVYRVSPTNHAFVEIQQLGVEYLGEITPYITTEVLSLAIETLEQTGFAHVLDMSHMGYVHGIMQEAKMEETAQTQVQELIKKRNQHELNELLDGLNINENVKHALMALTTLNGEVEEVLTVAEKYCLNEEMTNAVDALRHHANTLNKLGRGTGVRLDFSMINDMDYYNGLIFRGYIEHAPRVVLSGGRYDPLLEKLGKKANGLGFALYLNELETLISRPRDCDVEAVLHCEKTADEIAIYQAIKRLQKRFDRVWVQQDKSSKLRAKTHFTLVGTEVKEGLPC